MNFTIMSDQKDSDYNNGMEVDCNTGEGQGSTTPTNTAETATSTAAERVVRDRVLTSEHFRQEAMNLQVCEPPDSQDAHQLESIAQDVQDLRNTAHTLHELGKSTLPPPPPLRSRNTSHMHPPQNFGDPPETDHQRAAITNHNLHDNDNDTMVVEPVAVPILVPAQSIKDPPGTRVESDNAPPETPPHVPTVKPPPIPESIDTTPPSTPVTIGTNKELLLNALAEATEMYPIDMRSASEYAPYHVLYVSSSAFSYKENKNNIQSTRINLQQVMSHSPLPPVAKEPRPGRQFRLYEQPTASVTNFFLSGGTFEYLPQEHSSKIQDLFRDDLFSRPMKEAGLFSFGKGCRRVYALVSGSYHAKLSSLAASNQYQHVGAGVVGIRMFLFKMERVQIASFFEKWNISESVPIGHGRLPTELKDAIVWTSPTVKRRFALWRNKERYSYVVFDVLTVLKSSKLQKVEKDLLRKHTNVQDDTAHDTEDDNSLRGSAGTNDQSIENLADSVARIRGGGGNEDPLDIKSGTSEELALDKNGIILGFDLRTLQDTATGVAVLPQNVEVFLSSDFDKWLGWETKLVRSRPTTLGETAEHDVVENATTESIESKTALVRSLIVHFMESSDPSMSPEAAVSTHTVWKNETASFAEVEMSGPPEPPLSFREATPGQAEQVNDTVFDPGSKEILEASPIIYERPPDGQSPSRGYWVGRKLRKATFGVINECSVLRYRSDSKIPWEVTTTRVAVKKIVHTGKMKGPRHVEDPIKEAAAMRYLSENEGHPNVVSLLDYLEVQEDNDVVLLMFMPLYTSGDLFGFVQRAGRFPEPMARFWFRQILEGISHLHQHGICHRNLCLENILVADYQRAAITDLGMCLRIPYNGDDSDSVGSVENGTLRRLIKPLQPCGKPTYISPEVLQSTEPFDGFAIDLWAAAVMLFIMLVGVPPWDFARDADARFRLVMNGGLVRMLTAWQREISPMAADLLQRMLQRNPRERLSLAEVKKHPWIAEHETSGTPGTVRRNSTRSSVQLPGVPEGEMVDNEQWMQVQEGGELSF